MPKLRCPVAPGDAVSHLIYGRRRGAGDARYYADFRDYADVGGAQEPLTPAGAPWATTHLSVAKELAEARLKELQHRRSLQPTGDAALRRFETFAEHHLVQKAMLGQAREQWLAAAQKHLEVARDYFGANRDIGSITVRDVTEYTAHLRQLSNGRGETLSATSINHYLNSLSNLFRRAISESLIDMGRNPVAAMMGRPEGDSRETPFLEIPEVATILSFAKTYKPTRDDLALPCGYELIATLALTGCRESEVYGLTLDDIDLVRDTLRIRPTRERKLKSRAAKRVVPIWPQLHEVLEGYLASSYAPRGRLLFPGRSNSGDEAMVTELRKLLDKMPMPDRLRRERTPKELEAAEREHQDKISRVRTKRRGPKPTETLEELALPVERTIVPPLRTKMLRHSYCAARLQTVDGGKPVAHYTVARELGHQGVKMVEEVYGHLGTIRHRCDVVAFL